jgi:ubiquinone/menaquinone biosynthesis C-methylase UbiE
MHLSSLRDEGIRFGGAVPVVALNSARPPATFCEPYRVQDGARIRCIRDPIGFNDRLGLGVGRALHIASAPNEVGLRASRYRNASAGSSPSMPSLSQSVFRRLPGFGGVAVVGGFAWRRTSGGGETPYLEHQLLGIVSWAKQTHVQIDYQKVEQTVKAGYKQVTEQYRLDDEIEVTSGNHRRLSGTLKEICLGFPRPINVLDVGCGTGRYFHCLENVDRLVGLDISEEMLEAARNPVLADRIKVGKVELMRGNAYLADFREGEFELIYSLGMFGHGCPLTIQVLEKFYRWLKPGGKLFFNIVDFAGLPFSYRLRRTVKAAIYPVLPGGVKALLEKRESEYPFFWMTPPELRKILHASNFKRYEIKSVRCDSPLWEGRHLECIGTKT